MDKTKAILLKTEYDLEVKYAHLEKPDIYFGVPGEHSLTVSINSKLKADLTKTAKKLGIDKVNGIDSENNTIKFHSKVHIDKGKFPKIYDADVNLIQETIESGDKVRLNLVAKEAGSGVTFWLNAVQLIEKGEGGSSDDMPFTPVGSVKNGESKELPF